MLIYINIYIYQFELFIIQLDNRLAGQKYIFGDDLTETDINLYTSFIRFDKIYYTYFKVNDTLSRKYRY